MDHVSEGWRPQTRTLTQMHNRRLHRRAFTHSCRFKLKASNPSRIIHPRTSTDVFHYPISIICITFNSKTSAQFKNTRNKDISKRITQLKQIHAKWKLFIITMKNSLSLVRSPCFHFQSTVPYFLYFNKFHFILIKYLRSLEFENGIKSTHSTVSRGQLTKRKYVGYEFTSSERASERATNQTIMYNFIYFFLHLILHRIILLSLV